MCPFVRPDRQNVKLDRNPPDILTMKRGNLSLGLQCNPTQYLEDCGCDLHVCFSLPFLFFFPFCGRNNDIRRFFLLHPNSMW